MKGGTAKQGPEHKQKNIFRRKEDNMFGTLMVIFAVVYLIALFVGISVSLMARA